MSPREIVRTAMAIRLQSGGSYSSNRLEAEEIMVPVLEAGDDVDHPRLFDARVAVWSEHGRLRGEFLGGALR
jgi:hypothetical protein